MRRVFLWAARNRWLKERLPRFRFMRRAVRRLKEEADREAALPTPLAALDWLQKSGGLSPAEAALLTTITASSLTGGFARRSGTAKCSSMCWGITCAV